MPGPLLLGKLGVFCAAGGRIIAHSQVLAGVCRLVSPLHHPPPPQRHHVHVFDRKKLRRVATHDCHRGSIAFFCGDLTVGLTKRALCLPSPLSFQFTVSKTFRSCDSRPFSQAPMSLLDHRGFRGPILAHCLLRWAEQCSPIYLMYTAFRSLG